MHSLKWAVFIVLLPCMSFASEDSPQVRKLSEKVKAVQGKYRNEEKNLYDMDQEIFMIADRIAAVRKDIALKQESISVLEKDLKEYQTILSGHEERLRNNWIGLYKGSFSDMVDVYCSHLEYTGYLNSVIRYNNEVLREYQALRLRVADAKAALQEVSLALKSDLADLEDTVEQLHEERGKKAKLLASLKRESEDYRDRMQDLLKRMEEDKQRKEFSSADIFKKKGKLPWPVTGKVVRKFGTFRVGGVAQSSRGIDIEAEEGEPVKSVYGGKVVFVNWINVYGNTVIVDHGGGYYSVYGHLQKVAASVGDRISSRETIAEVGQSGDVVRPMLHFELRFRDKPQDPQGWLAGQ